MLKKVDRYAVFIPQKLLYEMHRELRGRLRLDRSFTPRAVWWLVNYDGPGILFPRALRASQLGQIASGLGVEVGELEDSIVGHARGLKIDCGIECKDGVLIHPAIAARAIRVLLKTKYKEKFLRSYLR